MQAALRHKMIIGQALNMVAKTCQYIERAGGDKDFAATSYGRTS